MSNDDEITIPSSVVKVASRELELEDTEQKTMQRTTLPEVPPPAADAESEKDSGVGSDVRPASAASAKSPTPSSSSFSGMLGRFHFVRVLGGGAFGTVVQAWDPELETHRAIKVPHRNLIESGRVDAESYVREARKLAQLGKHPGIVEVFDVQRMTDGTPFVVSEFISGGSLAERTRLGPLPWRDAVTLVAQIAEAIAYVHSKGLVHRDLKPANILFSDDGKPIVADFGLALSDDEFNYDRSVCGTYQYMSPQQVSGGADCVDGRSDIYSLGVILYQIVAGRPPYKSKTVESLKREILNDSPAPLRQYVSQTPAELEQVCKRAMAKDPEDRYSTAADFAVALRNLLKPAAEPSGSRLTFGMRFRSFSLTFAVGFCALFFAMITIGQYSKSWLKNTWESIEGREVSSKNETIVLLSADPKTVSADIQLQLLKAGQRVFSPKLEKTDLPLTDGDQLKFRIGRISQPAYPYVYSVDESGKTTRLWPKTIDQQSAVGELTIPSEDTWIVVSPKSGTIVFFAGVSVKKLGEAELAAFESRVPQMREALAQKLESSKRLAAEFKFSVCAGGVMRNATDWDLAIAPDSSKAYAADHSDLQKWFSAYRGWIITGKK